MKHPYQFCSFFQKDDKWEVRNPEGTVLGEYRTEDLRMTLVWRSLCFKTEDERKAWNPKKMSFDPQEALDVRSLKIECSNVSLISFIFRNLRRT